MDAHVAEKFGPRYFASAQRGEVPRVLLAVNHGQLVVSTKSDQRGQCDFRGIGLQGKHGFAKHRASEGHAIQTPHQLIVHPSFNAVRMSRLVKLFVGLNHFRQDPSTGLSLSFGAGTAANDLRKIVVNANLACAGLDKFAERFFQRAVEFEIVHFQNHARIGGPPKDGLTFAEPRKNTLFISFHQSFWMQAAPGCE